MTIIRKEVIGNQTLLLGDCLSIIPEIADQCGAILTDPPYGIADKWKGGSGHGWGKARGQTEARNEWDESPPPDALVWSWRKTEAPAIIWGGNYFDLGPARGLLVWNKPERNFTLAEAEVAWTNIDMRMRVFDHPRSEPGRVHPTQKPLALMSWCLGFLPKGAVVLDPFMGSGTTLVACEKAGRGGIGIERDPQWFEVACRRVDDAARQPDLFIAPKPDAPKQETLL